MKLKLANEERMAPHQCLKCRAINDAASGVVDRHARNTKKPKPGDLSLCLYCAHLMVYTDDLLFRELTKDEARHIMHDAKVQMALMAVKMTIDARTKH